MGATGLAVPRIHSTCSACMTPPSTSPPSSATMEEVASFHQRPPPPGLLWLSAHLLMPPSNIYFLSYHPSLLCLLIDSIRPPSIHLSMLSAESFSSAYTRAPVSHFKTAEQNQRTKTAPQRIQLISLLLSVAKALCSVLQLPTPILISRPCPTPPSTNWPGLPPFSAWQDRTSPACC